MRDTAHQSHQAIKQSSINQHIDLYKRAGSTNSVVPPHSCSQGIPASGLCIVIELQASQAIPVAFFTSVQRKKCDYMYKQTNCEYLRRKCGYMPHNLHNLHNHDLSFMMEINLKYHYVNNQLGPVCPFLTWITWLRFVQK